MQGTILNYSLDLTGQDAGHLVTETHTLDIAHTARTKVLSQGAYYYNSAKVVDKATGVELVRGTQWKPLFYIDEASVDSNKDVYAAIVVLDASVSNEVDVTYQVVGGVWQSLSGIVRDELERLASGGSSVDWSNLTNVPNFFPPAAHLHSIADIYGFENVVAGLERIRDAIVYGDKDRADGLRDALEQLALELRNRDTAIADALTAHEQDKNNSHDVTAEQVELGDVANYKIATLADALANSAVTYSTPSTVNAQIVSALQGNDLPNVNTHLLRVDGDSDKFYPVFIGTAGNTLVRKDITIQRAYSDTAPSGWITSGATTHKGAMNLTLKWSGDSDWGGGNRDIEVAQYYEKYNRWLDGGVNYGIVGGIQLTHNGLVIWLRGGGANYRIETPTGKNATIRPIASTTASDVKVLDVSVNAAYEFTSLSSQSSFTPVTPVPEGFVSQYMPIRDQTAARSNFLSTINAIWFKRDGNLFPENVTVKNELRALSSSVFNGSVAFRDSSNSTTKMEYVPSEGSLEFRNGVGATTLVHNRGNEIIAAVNAGGSVFTVNGSLGTELITVKRELGLLNSNNAKMMSLSTAGIIMLATSPTAGTSSAVHVAKIDTVTGNVWTSGTLSTSAAEGAPPTFLVDPTNGDLFAEGSARIDGDLTGGFRAESRRVTVSGTGKKYIALCSIPNGNHHARVQVQLNGSYSPHGSFEISYTRSYANDSISVNNLALHLGNRFPAKILVVRGNKNPLSETDLDTYGDARIVLEINHTSTQAISSAIIGLMSERTNRNGISDRIEIMGSQMADGDVVTAWNSVTASNNKWVVNATQSLSSHSEYMGGATMDFMDVIGKGQIHGGLRVSDNGRVLLDVESDLADFKAPANFGYGAAFSELSTLAMAVEDANGGEKVTIDPSGIGMESGTAADTFRVDSNTGDLTTSGSISIVPLGDLTAAIRLTNRGELFVGQNGTKLTLDDAGVLTLDNTALFKSDVTLKESLIINTPTERLFEVNPSFGTRSVGNLRVSNHGTNGDSGGVFINASTGDVTTPGIISTEQSFIGKAMTLQNASISESGTLWSKVLSVGGTNNSSPSVRIDSNGDYTGQVSTKAGSTVIPRGTKKLVRVAFFPGNTSGTKGQIHIRTQRSSGGHECLTLEFQRSYSSGRISIKNRTRHGPSHITRALIAYSAFDASSPAVYGRCSVMVEFLNDDVAIHDMDVNFTLITPTHSNTVDVTLPLDVIDPATVKNSGTSSSVTDFVTHQDIDLNDSNYGISGFNNYQNATVFVGEVHANENVIFEKGVEIQGNLTLSQTLSAPIIKANDSLVLEAGSFFARSLNQNSKISMNDTSMVLEAPKIDFINATPLNINSAGAGTEVAYISGTGKIWTSKGIHVGGNSNSILGLTVAPSGYMDIKASAADTTTAFSITAGIAQHTFTLNGKYASASDITSGGTLGGKRLLVNDGSREALRFNTSEGLVAVSDAANLLSLKQFQSNIGPVSRFYVVSDGGLTSFGDSTFKEDLSVEGNAFLGGSNNLTNMHVRTTDVTIGQSQLSFRPGGTTSTFNASSSLFDTYVKTTVHSEFAVKKSPTDSATYMQVKDSGNSTEANVKLGGGLSVETGGVGSNSTAFFISPLGAHTMGGTLTITGVLSTTGGITAGGALTTGGSVNARGSISTEGAIQAGIKRTLANGSGGTFEQQSIAGVMDPVGGLTLKKVTTNTAGNGAQSLSYDDTVKLQGGGGTVWGSQSIGVGGNDIYDATIVLNGNTNPRMFVNANVYLGGNLAGDGAHTTIFNSSGNKYTSGRLVMFDKRTWLISDKSIELLPDLGTMWSRNAIYVGGTGKDDCKVAIEPDGVWNRTWFGQDIRIGQNREGVNNITIYHATGDIHTAGKTTHYSSNTFAANARTIILNDPTGNIWCSGMMQNANGVVTSSDARMKKDIETHAGRLDDLALIRFIDYVYASDETKRAQTGVVAQELMEIWPDLVHVEETPDGERYAVNYTTMLVRCVAALRMKNEKQEARLKRLEEAVFGE